MKIIGLLQVKDEEDILAKTLDTNSWIDHVVAIDNGSTDNTQKILKSYPFVKYAYDEHFYHDMYFVPKLVSMAESLNADWYVSFDADEAFPDMRKLIASVIENDCHELAQNCNAISLDFKNMLNGNCVKEEKGYIRVYRNVPELFDFRIFKAMHSGKCPIPQHRRVVFNSNLKVLHYQIRSREQGLRKYQRHEAKDPDHIYQKQGYGHIKEMAMSL